VVVDGAALLLAVVVTPERRLQQFLGQHSQGGP
jgi:hypothetical protein